MFDVSISELILVAIVGFLILGPKELFRCIRVIRNMMFNCRAYYDDFMNYLSKEFEDDDYVKIIFDDEGLPQKVYDLEKIKPYINNEAEGADHK